MPSYSPTGYQAAVHIRTNRTLLVEGKSDRIVFASLFHELQVNDPNMAATLVIDTAEDIASLPGQRMTNRAKVEQTHALLATSPQHFAAVTDRDLSDFDIAVPADLAPMHYSFGTLFRTRGHSIENYFLCADCVAAYLETQAIESLPANHRQIIATHIPAILHACGCFFLAAFRCQILDRLTGIRDVRLWETTPSITWDRDALKTSIAARGVGESDVNQFLSFLDFYNASPLRNSPSLARWITRGHTALEHLWTAVAALLRHHGLSDPLVRKIAQDMPDLKFRVNASTWARSVVLGSDRDAPTALLEWLKGLAN